MGRLIFGMLIVAFIFTIGYNLVGRYRRRKTLESVQEEERLASMDGKILDVQERVVTATEANEKRRKALGERAQSSPDDDNFGEK